MSKVDLDSWDPLAGPAESVVRSAFIASFAFWTSTWSVWAVWLLVESFGFGSSHEFFKETSRSLTLVSLAFLPGFLASFVSLIFVMLPGQSILLRFDIYRVWACMLIGLLVGPVSAGATAYVFWSDGVGIKSAVYLWPLLISGAAMGAAYWLSWKPEAENAH